MDLGGGFDDNEPRGRQQHTPASPTSPPPKIARLDAQHPPLSHLPPAHLLMAVLLRHAAYSSAVRGKQLNTTSRAFCEASSPRGRVNFSATANGAVINSGFEEAPCC